MIELILAYIICVFSFIKELYVKIYPYFAISIGFIIFVGLFGGAEGDIVENYWLGVLQIIMTFLITTLFWKVCKLKFEKENTNEAHSYKRRNFAER